MVKKLINSIKEMKVPFSWKRVWGVIVGFIIVFGIAFTGLYAYGKTYDTRVLPGVRIGDTPVGGLDSGQLEQYLQDRQSKLFDDGIRIQFKEGDIEQSFVINPSLVGEDTTIDMIRVSIPDEVEYIMNYRKDGNAFVQGWTGLMTTLRRPSVSLTTVSLEKEHLFDELGDAFDPYETAPRSAHPVITEVNPLTYSVTSSVEGIEFDYEDIAGRVISSWGALQTPEITVTRTVTQPAVLDGDLEGIIDRLPDIFEQGSLSLDYTDAHTKRDYDWTISTQTIADWLEPQKNTEGEFGFGLSASPTINFLTEKIAAVTDVEAKNAKFEIGEDGKVKEFAGSRPGIGLDIDATYNLLNDAFLQRTWHDEGVAKTVAVEVAQVEPDIKTGEVNDLGIEEILGVGYSNFSGSPSNRIKNIRHAVENKLNGLLIEPAEDFSLIGALEPFTIAGGYLPELVIKGDKIEPEIGGGLCQIGSTMFRTAMNSGMPITERRNHSLVVNYYNDHRNNKPGTDATIYDPAPDFRFKNDTGNYILITTEMNVSNGDLRFTLWGTGDGREGSYTEPVVHRWIGTGPTKYVETKELAPGQEKCQGAHTGAETSFTYNRTLPNGETAERVFTSYYRPLPRICLKGVAEHTQCQETGDGAGCAPPEGGADTPADGAEGEAVPPAVDDTPDPADSGSAG